MANEIKKSLLVTLDFPPNNVGGVATFYYNVCKNLPPDKIVVLAPDHPDANNFDQKQHFTIIRKKLLNQFPQKMPAGLGGIIKIAATVRWLSLIKNLNEIVKTHQIKLIQVGQVLPIGTLALVLKKRLKIPYIFYAHGLDILLPQKFMRKKTILKNIIKESSGIVANSHFTKDELLKLGANNGQVTVVYPGANIKNHHVADSEIAALIKKHQLENKKILLTVGRLVERKGHDVVIKSLPAIIKKIPNITYLIVGDGPRKTQLVNLVHQLRLGHYVQFVDRVANSILPAYYQLADVFIMPSRRINGYDVEGFGIVFIEANLFGKPVIGGRSGGVGEAIVDGQTGILVNPTSEEEVSRSVIKLLTDPALAERLGLQGMERALRDFDWQTQTKKIKDLLS
ncbi:MAG: glycosyltransferase family 4 protein [Candidatus Buchananbacteria bacterium]|nr:glycosyltransferase family 4 protein [Candidatus Buchananbacteria bacterium]